MKISFVIPAWNEEKYIAQSLESIIERAKYTSHEVEIIAVNNASVDKTRDIILQYSEVILVDEPKKGLPQARQAGFLASTGDIIANMDADSILPPKWIGRAVYEFSKDEKLVALSGPYRFYDMPGIINFSANIFYFPGYLIHLFNHHILGKGAMLQGGNFVLRRSALESIGGFDVNIKFYGEDTDIARRISKAGKVKFSHNFIMTTSGRRLKKEGLFTTLGRYVINHLWILLFKKPLTKNYAYVGDEKAENRK
ncbi:MAG: glycosyltransferase family 2 protein [Parcubacteria group bacterium]|jgi:glycosyltransferase involved in cell wall biosynthesis